jgi:hypothetical protein
VASTCQVSICCRNLLTTKPKSLLHRRSQFLVNHKPYQFPQQLFRPNGDSTDDTRLRECKHSRIRHFSLLSLSKKSNGRDDTSHGDAIHTLRNAARATVLKDIVDAVLIGDSVGFCGPVWGCLVIYYMVGAIFFLYEGQLFIGGGSDNRDGSGGLCQDEACDRYTSCAYRTAQLVASNFHGDDIWKVYLGKNSLSRFERHISVECIPSSDTGTNQGSHLRESQLRMRRNLGHSASGKGDILAKHPVNWTSVTMNPIRLRSVQIPNIKVADYMVSGFQVLDGRANFHYFSGSIRTWYNLLFYGHWIEKPFRMAMSRKLRDTARTLMRTSCLSMTGMGSWNTFKVRCEPSSWIRNTV